jgi:hypothetical protein
MEMELRTRGFLREWEYDFEDFARAQILAFVLLAFAWLICCGVVYPAIFLSGNTAATQRATLESTLNDVSEAQRQETASSYLVVNSTNSGVLDSYWYDANERDQLIAQLQTVAETGIQASFDTEVVGWDIYRQYWLWPSVILTILVISNIAFGWYAHSSKNAYHFIADLRWKNPGAWLFVLATLLPVGFIAYPVSFIRLRRFRRDTPIEQQRPASYRHPPTRTFSPNADAAKAWYVSRLTIDPLKERKKEIQACEKEIRSSEESIESLGEKLEDAQKSRLAAKRELKRLEATPIPAMNDSLHLVESEFTRLTQLHGVTGIGVDERNHLIVKVEVRVLYKKELYDFGDWEVSISNYSIDTKQLRSAAKAGMRGTYPDYAYSDGRFCLGNLYQLEDLVRSNRVFDAVSLAVANLHRVNKDNRSSIPRVFKVVKQ